MNIVVRPYGESRCYCRPDTTWEKENRDFYIPEGIEGLYWAPVVFVRISKAGKCIGKKFVSRYYDAFSFGILMYCSEDKDRMTGTAFSSCLDHTSLLPFPLYDTIVMEGEDNVYDVCCEGRNIFSFKAAAEHEGSTLKEIIEEALCQASSRTSLRIGDMVAVELSPVSLLASIGGNSELEFKGTFCDNVLFDLKLVF